MTLLWCAAVLAVAASCVADLRIQRLPQTVWPVQYTLTVYTDLFGRNFNGNVTVELEAREASDNITLNSRGLLLGTALLSDAKGEDVPLQLANVDNKAGLVTFSVNSSLVKDERYRLQIPFSGHLNTARQRGYYRIRTGTQDTDWMTGTVFEYNHAREAFPCFDEPQFKAKFRISLIHHRNHSALSNMPLNSTENHEDREWVIDHFNNSPVMSSYLVAYHLLKYDHREVITEDGRPLRVWARARQLRWANHSLALGPKALNWLQQYTGLPDPLPKLDLVAVPRFQGGLENWGVISFMPAGLLYRPQWEGVLRQVQCSKLVTHELAHTWYGNLVTPLWWDSLWLSEGAATFFTSLALDQLQPDWDQLTEDTEEYLSTTFYTNAVSSGRPLSHPVELIQDLRTISYEPYYKGFSLLRMVYLSLGPEQFQAGMQRYLAKLQYRSTTPELLYGALQYTHEGRSLEELMHSWTYQLGLPVVTANRTEGQLTLSQERFHLNLLPSEETREEEEEDAPWWVPVSFTSQSQRQFEDSRPSLWLYNDTAIPDPAKPGEWLLLNIQAAGTYHVRYDKANLQLLKAALNSSSDSEAIPPLNRLQLVLDYGMFALAGTEPLAEVLELLDFLGAERHSAPWAAAVRTLWRMEQRLRGTPAAYALKERVRRLVTPEWSRLGMKTRKGDSVADIRQRQQIVLLACHYRLPACITRSGRLMQKWMNQTQPDKVIPIPPEVRFPVYCTAAKFESIRHWEFLQERALRSRDPVTRDLLFTALGCSNQYHLLYRFMETHLQNSSVTRHDFTKLLQGLIQHNNDVGPVLDYMENSMSKLKSTSKKKLRWNQTMLRDLAQQIVSPQQFDQLKNLMSSSKTLTKDEMTNLKRTVEHNSVWREMNKNTW